MGAIPRTNEVPAGRSRLLRTEHARDVAAQEAMTAAGIADDKILQAAGDLEGAEAAMAMAMAKDAYSAAQEPRFEQTSNPR